MAYHSYSRMYERMREWCDWDRNYFIAILFAVEEKKMNTHTQDSYIQLDYERTF